MSRTGIAIVALFLAAAIASPWLAPFHPRNDTEAALAPPSSRHLLGTDDVGRDILSQVLAGTRISLAVGFGAGAAATVLGVIVGLLAGYLGGWWDRILMRGVDFFLAVPRLPLLIVLAAYLGAGLWVVVVSFVLISWAFPARMIRAQVLVEKRTAYVTAARLAGCGRAYILWRHVLPPLLPLVLVVSIMETRLFSPETPGCGGPFPPGSASRCCFSDWD
jgi:peptide/nickel transport system permease protein